MKKVVLAFNGHETQIDPQFCPHKSVVQQTIGSMYHNGRELVDTTETIYQCLDCGKEWRDEVEQTDEIPY